jgi:hypothetical protein
MNDLIDIAMTLITISDELLVDSRIPEFVQSTNAPRSHTWAKGVGTPLEIFGTFYPPAPSLNLFSHFTPPPRPPPEARVNLLPPSPWKKSAAHVWLPGFQSNSRQTYK